MTDGLASGNGVVLWDPFLAVPASPEDCLVTIEDIPTLPPPGLALLVLALTGGALVLLRRWYG